MRNVAASSRVVVAMWGKRTIAPTLSVRFDMRGLALEK
jgi:hypothetical protein